MFSSKELADYAPNAKIDVFRQGGDTDTLVGTCALGSISGPLTLCVIERPDGTLGRGRYLAKPAQEKP